MKINGISETKREILKTLKEAGSASIAKLQSELNMTGEALRQQLLQLKHEGFVERKSKKRKDPSGGRPAKQYFLTPEGEHLFPKNYDALTKEIIDTISDELGPDALTKLLETMTENRVNRWEPQLRHLPFKERVEALKGLYMQNDAFMEAEYSEDAVYLMEHNCPFLNVASERPALCSVTTSTLSKLLGYRVERTKRFQNGDGRCVFKIDLSKPVGENDPVFEYEKE
ncbi:MAG TPA: methanogen output domain 1-containing protein [Bacillales bacterium]|nr:methanogen output domain 1-containing protein [Bacillales bacterium]